MQKKYKLNLSIIALTVSTLFALAQEKVEYKDVILDGKSAKLNVVTGEIILIDFEDKKADKQIVDKDIMPVIITNEGVINATSALKVNDSTSDFYVVKEGETLFKIANLYHTSLTELRKANNLETTLIDKGQTLIVKNFEAYPSYSSLNKTSVHSLKNISNFHSVERGETLSGIARRYSLSINELKSKNSLNTDLIKVGQKLIVRDFGTTNEINNMSVWTVAKGDTLYSISKKSGTTVENLKALNNLTDNSLMIGQILQLKIENYHALKIKKSYPRFKIDLVILHRL